VHFLMLIITATIFTVGVIFFIIDFFRYSPRFEEIDEESPALRTTGETATQGT